ncbi:hypothetical protein ACQYRI_16760 [Salmonella enterica]
MSNKKRVMWLLNHTTAREFEVPMLKACGFDEVFLPKSFPTDIAFSSASVDWSEDHYLTIPTDDLTILNETDWYSGGCTLAWEIANKWFDAIFFIVYDEKLIKNIAYNFNGICLWRIFGLALPMNYDKILFHFSRGKGFEYIQKIGKRLKFAVAYPHLADNEPSYLHDRAIYLPAGLKDTQVNDKWNGNTKKIIFICPDIAFNDYYKRIYYKFKKDFSNFDYIIGGSQPIKVPDKNVLGFVSNEEYIYNMQSSAVMFYSSQEPNHIHYHPFEAVKNGLPLIFMSGGLLDKLGGSRLPGRCRTIAEARRKIALIIAGDKKFIKKVKSSQPILLKAMDFEKLKSQWLDGISRIDIIPSRRENVTCRDYSNKKIAIILPVGYLGGTLRGAILLANTIKLGSEKEGDKCQIVFYHPDLSIYQSEQFEDLSKEIVLRSFVWKKIDRHQAERMMNYSGYDGWRATYDEYSIPDDGINYACDCDLWLVISDRLEVPLLPARPIVLMVYDYIQRRQRLLPQNINQIFINAARNADKVFVTTECTYQDALNYAGIKKEQLSKLPMLIPDFTSDIPTETKISKLSLAAKKNRPLKTHYFIWVTNTSVHKHPEKVAKALKVYYEELNGKYRCLVTGVDTESMQFAQIDHLIQMQKIISSSQKLRDQIEFKGNLIESEYKKALRSATFLLHSSHGDNGTFSIIEAAFNSVPALVNNYPAVQEMDKIYNLNMNFYNIADSYQFACQLKRMEKEHLHIRKNLPRVECLKQHLSHHHGHVYWNELKELL